MRKNPIKTDKPLSKRALRQQKMEAMRKKQLDTAYEYPFCRRCKEPLDPKWAKELKKKGHIPLCKNCFEPMMKQFEKVQELWQKFKQ